MVLLLNVEKKSLKFYIKTSGTKLQEILKCDHGKASETEEDSCTYKYSRHSHSNHTLKIAKAELKKALKEAGCQNFEGYRVVFDRVCNKPEDKYAATHVTYASIVSAIQSSRAKCFPRTPKSAHDFH